MKNPAASGREFTPYNNLKSVLKSAQTIGRVSQHYLFGDYFKTLSHPKHGIVPPLTQTPEIPSP
jgi:hypothetical protein